MPNETDIAGNSEDLLPKHITLLDSLKSIGDSMHHATVMTSSLFKEQHLKAAIRNIQMLSEYIEKNKCNFIVFENPQQ